MRLRESRIAPRGPRRRGVAAIELAFITVTFMVPTMIAIWEIARYIHVKQIVSNSAREGARFAAQGYTINNSGNPTQVMVSSGTQNVHDTVYRYLIGAGLTNLEPSEVVVTFQFLAPTSQGTTPTEPYLGEKNMPLLVSVTIPWHKVRWLNFGLIEPAEVSYTARWQMLIDEKFTVNEILPTW